MNANYKNVLNEIRNDTEVGMPKTESEKRKKRLFPTANVRGAELILSSEKGNTGNS